MPQLTQDEQMARHIRAIYNYNVGQPRAVGRFIILLLLAAPVAGLILGVLSYLCGALGQ